MRLLSFFMMLLSTVMAAKYDGMFKLASATDKEGHNLVLPPGNKPFVLVLRSESDTHYALSLRLGNSLRSDMVITPSDDEDTHDSVRVGDVMSTMMMPPEAIFRVETFLTSNLPKTTNIYMEDDDDVNKLIFEGAAKIVFARE